MPGRPVLAALADRIDAAGGEEYFFGRVADGATMEELAAEFQISRTQLYFWLDLEPERRRGMLAAARRLAADKHVEEAMQILDQAPTTNSVHVRKAEARAAFRRWLAGVRNREEYGDASPYVSVQISTGERHLDALRHRVVTVADAVEVRPEPAQHLPPAAGPDGAGIERDTA